MEAEELMEDLIQFSILFFSCLDQMWWMMNGYKKSSGVRRDEPFWMRKGPWIWAVLDPRMCVLFCSIIVAVIWFDCPSCGALQGQIQSLHLLHGLHLTDLTSQWTSLSTVSSAIMPLVFNRIKSRSPFLSAFIISDPWFFVFAFNRIQFD